MIKIGRKHTHGLVSSLIIGGPGPAPYEILWGGGEGGQWPLGSYTPLHSQLLDKVSLLAYTHIYDRPI